MTPAQKAQLTQYAAQQGSSVNSTTNNADGTQDICVLQPDGKGGYNEQYYKRSDHFSDYLLYSMLLGRSNTLLTYGVLAGDLDVGQAMALSLLTGVNRSGQMYHPYSNVGGTWERHPSVVSNTTVRNVYYGARSKPVPYSKAWLEVPKDFVAKPIPPATDKVATVTKSANGKATVTKKSDTGAAQTIKKSYPPVTSSNKSKSGSGTGSGSVSNTKSNTTQKRSGSSSFKSFRRK